MELASFVRDEQRYRREQEIASNKKTTPERGFTEIFTINRIL